MAGVENQVKELTISKRNKTERKLIILHIDTVAESYNIEHSSSWVKLWAEIRERYDKRLYSFLMLILSEFLLLFSKSTLM